MSKRERSSHKPTPLSEALTAWVKQKGFVKRMELIAEGRMRPAGLKAFEARSPEKTAIYSYERETAAFTKEQQARFEADEAAWAFFRAQAPSYRRSVTHWVSSARREETRERRFEKLLEDSRAGRRTGALG